jgi:hypothetical protein
VWGSVKLAIGLVSIIVIADAFASLQGANIGKVMAYGFPFGLPRYFQ